MKKFRKPQKPNRLYSSILLSAKESQDCATTSFECDLHLNLWKLANDKYMFDFGLMLYDLDYRKDSCHNFESIKLYLPYKCSKTEIHDLGKVLNSDKDLVSTVFNESYGGQTGPDKSSMMKYVQKSDTKNSFYLYEMGDNDITLENIEGCEGVFIKLTIPIPNEIKGDIFNLYLRFRVDILSLEGLLFLKHDEHIANNVMQAAFSRMELYDCRFNDIRDTDDKVYQELISKSQYQLLNMRKVHFFFMTDAKDHIANGNMERMDTRMLEIEKWKGYIGEEKSHAFVAYHWKKKKEGETFTSFEVFFRDTCNNANKTLICSYIALLLAFGTTGSLISTINFSAPMNWSGIIANLLLYLLFVTLYYLERWKS